MNESIPPNITPPPAATMTREVFLKGVLGIPVVASGLRPDQQNESPTFSAQEAHRLLVTSANSLQQKIMTALSEPKKRSLAPVAAGMAIAAMPEQQTEEDGNPPYLLPDYDASIKAQYLIPDPDYLKQIAPIQKDRQQPNKISREQFLKWVAVGGVGLIGEEIARKSGRLGKILGKTKEALAHQLKQVEAFPVLFNPNKIFAPPSSEAPKIEKQPIPVIRLEDAPPLAFQRPSIWCDSNNPVHWDGDKIYIFNSSKGAVYRSSGPDLLHLRLDAQPVLFDNKKLKDNTWIEATYKDTGGRLYGWYHHENYSGLEEQNKSREQKVCHPQIGALVSDDNGATWKNLGLVIDAPQNSFRLDQTENLFFAGGVGDFSVVPDEKGEYLNFFFTNYHKDSQYQGVSMARMPIKNIANPAEKVEMWHEKKWQKIALDGKSTPIFQAEGNLHTGDTKFFWGPAIHYNTELKTYVMLLNRSDDAAYTQEGVYASYNPDIADPTGWSKPIKIHTPTSRDSWYPEIIGTEKGETDKRLGKGRFFERGESKKKASFSAAVLPSEPVKQPSSEPASTIKEKIGERHAVEFFLGDLVHQFQKRRLEKAAADPAFAERIHPELLNSQTMNFLYLGTDETRERPDERGFGRSDVVMLISFNPHTLKTNAVSFPRDLYVPKVNAVKGLAGGRINGITVAPFVDKSINEFDLAKQVVESATGAPVDGVIKTNIDFMQGFEQDGISGIFDILFPEGLEIDVPRRIVDPKYPTINYGTKTLVFEPGAQRMNGARLVEYSRTRHADSDFGRGNRQQQVLFSGIKTFLPSIIKDAVIGHTATLDTAIVALEQQKEQNNISSDIDIVEILKTIKNHLVTMRKSTQGTSALGILAANTTGFVETLRLGDKHFFSQFGINRETNTVGGAVLGGALQLAGADPKARPTQNGNYLAYWEPLRERLKSFFHGDMGINSIEITSLPPPTKEERILHPKELSYNEVRPYLGRLRNTHDAIITESLFTKELAGMPEEKRQQVLQAIAKAHAKALVEHYGDTEALIGLDPGHGGSEGGSAAGLLVEKNLNWQVSQMIAEEIYELTKGQYTTVFLRPENPHDEDLNKDGITHPIERIQKRKALLIKMEDELRLLTPAEKGKNIVYLSVHFNGSDDKSASGTEVYYPNEVGMNNKTYRTSSKNLAQKLQAAIVAAVQNAGYPTLDRGAKEDPDRKEPTSHADTKSSYLALGSVKLTWNLTDPTKPYNKAA